MDKDNKSTKMIEDKVIVIQENHKELSAGDIFLIIGCSLFIIIFSTVSVLGIIALLALVIVLFQKIGTNCSKCIGKITDYTTNATDNINTIHINSPDIINENVSIPTNECIDVIQDTVGEHIKRREFDEPFIVSSFIRNLPQSHHASEAKLAYCAANGIVLGENQTFVNGYIKGIKS